MRSVDSFPQAISVFGTHATQADGAAVNVSADGSAYAEATWGDRWGNIVSFTTGNALGASSPFFFIAPSSNIGTSLVNTTQYGFVDPAGTFQAASFTLAANGQLSYIVPPAIPVPAAVWLLGSALVGLVGVARRRSAV